MRAELYDEVDIGDYGYKTPIRTIRVRLSSLKEINNFSRNCWRLQKEYPMPFDINNPIYYAVLGKQSRYGAPYYCNDELFVTECKALRRLEIEIPFEMESECDRRLCRIVEARKKAEADQIASEEGCQRTLRNGLENRLLDWRRKLKHAIWIADFDDDLMLSDQDLRFPGIETCLEEIKHYKDQLEAKDEHI